jgi:hypothetical protein
VRVRARKENTAFGFWPEVLFLRKDEVAYALCHEDGCKSGGTASYFLTSALDGEE